VPTDTIPGRDSICSYLQMLSLLLAIVSVGICSIEVVMKLGQVLRTGSPRRTASPEPDISALPKLQELSSQIIHQGFLNLGGLGNLVL